MRPSASLSLRIKTYTTHKDTPKPKAAAVQAPIPAAYYRGGTSRAVFFQPQHLPPDRAQWPGIFRQTMGSGDLYGRQLDGMGAGISSLSKICLVEPYGGRKVVSKQAIADRVQYQSLDGARDLLQNVLARGDAVDGIDVDYTFVGLGIESDEVDVAGNCGNMSSAIGPYAYNAGLLPPRIYAKGNGEVTVRIRNTNTGKLISATFHVDGGQATVAGDYTIDGVTGPGSRITLDFERPYGSKTGKVLPTGNKVDRILDYKVTCVDGANPCIFIRASDVGVDGTVLPSDFNKLPEKLALLESIRKAAAVAMGIAPTEDTVPRTIPKIGIVSMSSEHPVLSGQTLLTSQTDLVVRFLSDTQPHRAIPLTAALTTAVAARIPGTIVEQLLAPDPVVDGVITIGHASGRLQVDATMDKNDELTPVNATVYRTAKRLFEGTTFWVDNVANTPKEGALRSVHGMHGTHSLGMAFVLESRGQSTKELYAGEEEVVAEHVERKPDPLEELGFTRVRMYSSTHKVSPKSSTDPITEKPDPAEIKIRYRTDEQRPSDREGIETYVNEGGNTQEQPDTGVDHMARSRTGPNKHKLSHRPIATGKARSLKLNVRKEKLKVAKSLKKRRDNNENKTTEAHERSESEKTAMREMIDRDRAREARWAQMSSTKDDSS
ncbi:PrpF protein-domain-containing protein [Boeremia exigua]|uniref:PrpF protein-domain-containing protein n=1 Tax=Boeremia exigua TaxID=749465 RepID=UPI001E8DCE7F|nr:PrpF protein-domain-containing protein [Boeremia exigua]KAH6618874.1 PrpF protein-domain-containing protein [Boeremia exigua]